MNKHLLIVITCLHISNIKASGKNDELMAMLHSPVKTAELKRSLEHPHFRGIFVEQAPQTPVRGAQFFQKKAKSHLRYVMAYSAAHATALHQDAKKLYERLPEGESPQRKPTLKDSPNTALNKALNFAIASEQLNPAIVRGDVTQQALIMRRKARENNHYVKPRSLTTIFARQKSEQLAKALNEDIESEKQEKNFSDSAQVAAAASAPAFVPESAPQAEPKPLQLDLSNVQEVVAAAEKADKENIKPKPKPKFMGLKQAGPGKIKKPRKPARVTPLTTAKIEKNRITKAKELEKAAQGSKRLK